MKHIFVMLLSTFVAAQSSAQKDNSGIFKTGQDFQQRKLTCAINCKTEKHKINPNFPFKAFEVKVKHGGITYNLKKSELFAYKKCDGREYSFVGNDKEYEILNPGEPVLI